MSPVLKQDLNGLLDSLLVKPAGGHVMQEGNVSDNLLGVVVLASDRHLLPPLLLNKIMPDLFSSSQRPEGRQTSAVTRSPDCNEHAEGCAPLQSGHRRPHMSTCGLARAADRR